MFGSIDVLAGITTPGYGLPPKNPEAHSPLYAFNVVRMKVVGPDGDVKQEIGPIKNIMCTSGLNQLCQLVATGGQASSWISAGRIGTDTTAAASTQDALGASTGSVAITGASMSVSNLGARTARYLMTFASNNPAGVASIQEIGLFCNSTANSQLAARSVLGTASVSKGASDAIQCSYDVVFSTSSTAV